jgi:hypothetical protein
VLFEGPPGQQPQLVLLFAGEGGSSSSSSSMYLQSYDRHHVATDILTNSMQ